MNERLDMDAINRQYFEKRGYTKSNKNQAADYFVQLAASLGFSLDLLKEDWNHNKRYSFAPQDVELINDMLDRIKSREGKRLRCRDYQGAGGEFLYRLITDILHLFRSNGVPEGIVWEQEIKMHILSAYTALISEAIKQRHELKEYADSLLFLDSRVGEMDGFSQMDQYVYWTYLIEHPEIDIDEALGIYWCWWGHHFDTRYEQNYSLHKQIRHLDEPEYEVYQQLIASANYFTELVESDAELQNALAAWRRINYGGGKLKDNKRLAELDRQIAERFEQHITAITGASTVGTELLEIERTYPYTDLFRDSSQSLFEARKLYHERVEACKRPDPRFGDAPSSMEIAYQRRFRRPLVRRDKME